MKNYLNKFYLFSCFRVYGIHLLLDSLDFCLVVYIFFISFLFFCNIIWFNAICCLLIRYNLFFLFFVFFITNLFLLVFYLSSYNFVIFLKTLLAFLLFYFFNSFLLMFEICLQYLFAYCFGFSIFLPLNHTQFNCP